MKTTVRLTLRVTQAEAEDIKSAAQADGRSVNSWVRHTLGWAIGCSPDGKRHNANRSIPKV